MLGRGSYLAPSQYEAMFISEAITPAIVSEILEASSASLKEVN
jgi:glutamate-1-semialdehyde 2,1-aminomutase